MIAVLFAIAASFVLAALAVCGALLAIVYLVFPQSTSVPGWATGVAMAAAAVAILIRSLLSRSRQSPKT
jgi:hypothetical protein